MEWIGTLKPLIVPSFFGDAFSIFLLRQFFMTIPEELSDSARVDGLSELRILWEVIVPLSKPAIAAVGLFNFIFAWNNFYDPLVYLGQNPESQTLSLALSSFQHAAPRAVEPDHGGRADLHAPGDRDLLRRAARVHRRRHTVRREGVTVPMRVALFGSGWIMDFHARGVQEHSGAEIAGAANWRPESLAAFAERHGIARTTTDWRELAADPDVDAVVIGTPEQPARRAGDRLPARPASTCWSRSRWRRTLAEAEAMIAAADASGRMLMVAHCWRFHADVQALRRRVEAGELGEIVKTRGYGVHAAWGPSGWFTDPQLAGGGGAGRHGRARDRHGALPARATPSRARLRHDRHPLRRLRRGRRRRSC